MATKDGGSHKRHIPTPQREARRAGDRGCCLYEPFYIWAILWKVPPTLRRLFSPHLIPHCRYSCQHYHCGCSPELGQSGLLHLRPSMWELYNMQILSVLRSPSWIGKMVQQLRTLAILPEALGSVPRTHVGKFRTAYNSSS